MASETACDCGPWGHTSTCGDRARAEVVRLRARVAEAEEQLSAALAEAARLRLAAPAPPQPQPLSCPFCGGPCRTYNGGPTHRSWFVGCKRGDCGVAGPNYPTEAEAVREWAAIRVARDR